MAQLPPNFPDNISIPQAWHHHNLPRPPSTSSFFPPTLTHVAGAAVIHPSWADEFFDFSSAKRGAHRRTMSDSIAFLESTVPGPSPSGAPPASSSSDFDRLDDAQLISMFSDHVPPSSSTAPSTPSDNNSINDHGASDPHDPSEAQSASNAELTAAADASPATLTAPIGDPRRVKRILANRQSAQRSRVRKLHYISELERSVTTLQTEVSALSPRVAFFDHQRSILTVGNSHLKQRIAALAQDQIFKDAHQEALRKEIERLRNVYHQQNLKKLAVAADSKELPANT